MKPKSHVNAHGLRADSGRFVHVVDRELLAAVAEWIADNHGTKGPARADRRRQPSWQPTLYRLRKKAEGRIREKTLAQFLDLLAEYPDARLANGMGAMAALNLAIVAPEVEERVYWYHQRLRARVADAMLSRGETWTAEDAAIMLTTRRLGSGGRGRGARAITSGPGYDRSREYRSLLAHLRRGACRKMLDEFNDWAVEKGHNTEERRIAVLRALAPLLEFEVTAGIELSWRELSPKTLTNFVRHSLARERILLGRSPALVRAQETDARDRNQR
jgi:hypothetical protein